MRSAGRRNLTRIASIVAGALALGGASCRKSASVVPTQTGPNAGAVDNAVKAVPVHTPTESEVLKPRPELPPDKRALIVLGTAENPEERWIDAAGATAAGYTLVNLADDWTPAIFAEHIGADGAVQHNRYRRVLLGLSNDQLDEDGLPLPPGAANYLELYGAFPSLSVLRARFVGSKAHPCDDATSVAALEAVETVTYIAPADLKKDERKLSRIRSDLETARKKAKLETVQELVAAQPSLAAGLALIDKRKAEAEALTAVEQRLTCEGILTPASKHKVGIYDEPMRLAVRRFQQKHMIYEANYLRKKTVDALARPLLDNDYDSLVRALRERVVSAAGIIEDGSATNSPNLVDEYLKATLEQLRLPNTAAAMAFFERRGPNDFARIQAAIKLPKPPDYYAEHMELSIVVDRGDVWYDPPFDAQGNFRPQGRKRYPSLTLYATVNGEKHALARWRTTIGGWRGELASNGYEYLRYKMSDVGPRVIRQVIAGPVWIAPTYTPVRGLVKGKQVNGRWSTIVNYDELGPGYLSAYGLVAGYFVIPGQDGKPDIDNGVRAHGSSDYLSIYSSMGFSHGCHRLPNHIAIRLYSFILRHRHMNVAGDQPLGFSRQFLWKDNVYEMRLPSRGFLYELDPPLPVTVLEGTIRGNAKKPIPGYVAEPWQEYPPGLPPPGGDTVELEGGGLSMLSHFKKAWRWEIAALALGALVALTLRAAGQDPKPPLPAPAPAAAPTTAPAATNGEKPVNEESATVSIVVTVVPARRATVLWGKRMMGVVEARGALVIQRPRDSGPLDLIIKADGCMAVHSRAYTFSDSQLAVRVMSYEQRSTLLGYKQEVVPDAGLALPAPELPAAPP